MNVLPLSTIMWNETWLIPLNWPEWKYQSPCHPWTRRLMVHISIIFLHHFIYFSVLPFRSEDAQPGLQNMLGTLIQLPGNFFFGVWLQCGCEQGLEMPFYFLTCYFHSVSSLASCITSWTMMTCTCLPNSDKNDLSNPFQARSGLWDESANDETIPRVKIKRWSLGWRSDSWLMIKSGYFTSTGRNLLAFW